MHSPGPLAWQSVVSLQGYCLGAAPALVQSTAETFWPPVLTAGCLLIGDSVLDVIRLAINTTRR